MALGPALLLAAVLALPAPGSPASPPGGPGPPRLRVRFSPPRCCPGGRCVPGCRPRGEPALPGGGHGDSSDKSDTDGTDGTDGPVLVLESGRDPPAGSGFRLVLCPLLCQNGGLCAHPQRCLCPPQFTGKFCHLPSGNVTSGRGGPQNPQNPRGGPQNPQNVEGGSPQALTRSIYTLPLSNHREEEDGAQSMASVVVRHPPQATVTIHSVERVRGGADPSPAPPSPPPQFRGSPPPQFRVLAQRGPGRDPPAGENSGFGYCFRQLRDGQCRSPLPGLRTRAICCRGGAGLAWGVRECHPCDGHAQPCPPGFQRQNGTCVDVDECQSGALCQLGLCTNTRGSFACLCPPGFLLDSSRSRCISQQVLSEARGPCFRLLREGGGCALPTLRNITRQVCCCSRVGKAWGGSCLLCPPFGSEGFREICPAGPGYHYSASDLRINTQYLGQDGAGVPLGPPLSAPTTTPAPEPPRAGTPPPPPPGPEVIVVPRPSPHFGGAPPTLSPPEPVSPCQRDPSVCGPGRCVPRGAGGYTCLCRGGFWLSPQGTHCVDIDECRQVPPPCSPGRCENSVGSFRCTCGPGYTSEPAGTECRDIDECAQVPGPCAHGRCENRPGGYQCLCPAGYRGSGSEPCQDIDECENHLACPGQECVNTPGSFRCQPCPDGFHLRQGRCADVDECLGGSPCAPHGRCLNTVGSFRCECQRGYRATAGATACHDVNECLEGDFCFPHGECVNTAGSFRCLCADGFTATADGTACTDVDECQRGAVCVGGRCLNTEGSFQCQCPAGFRTDDAKAECRDVDECQEYGAGLCGAQRCENIPGSYRCVPECQPGFRPGDGEDCIDVDECQEYGAGLCGAQRCENIPGSYRCVPECQPGFRPGDGGDCIDVDECSNGTLCGAHATCHNLPGSFQCACDPGYETARHGHHCVDVDECQTLRGVCGAERCENVEGSFLCLCPDSRQEFDPVSGRCGALPTPQSPEIRPQVPQMRPQTPQSPEIRPQIPQMRPQTPQSPQIPQNPQMRPQSPELRPQTPQIGPQTRPQTPQIRAQSPEIRPQTPQIGPQTRPQTPQIRPQSPEIRPQIPQTRPQTPQVGPQTPQSRPQSPEIRSQTPEIRPQSPQTRPQTPQTRPQSPAGDFGVASCFSRACGVLAPNVTHPQCCCTLGWAWGAQCPGQPCPAPGTDAHLSLCPHGPGRLPETPQGPPTDVDECSLFGPALCRGGLCVNAAPSFSCFCPSGFYFEQEHLQCVDNDECAAAEAEPCLGGLCVNTVGSYLCSCPPPLVLDPSQRRCVANDTDPEGSVAVCWQQVGPDLVCGRPRRAAPVTYSECCCLYGQAWGMECALCPAPHSDDFELLCNVLRPPNFAPPLYDPPQFRPSPSPIRAPPPPPLRGSPPPPNISGGSAPPFTTPPLIMGAGEGEGAWPTTPFTPLPLPSPLATRISGTPPGGGDPDLSPPGMGGGGPRWNLQAHGTPEEEEEEEEEGEEECGVLSGCTHGRCVRVGDAFTCACDPGFHLDPARLDCLDPPEAPQIPQKPPQIP
ncbi:LOW QUALITY PROTEIN: latent-transforming growth factor beta-binding protein 4-like [Ammospiza caudacuta]|uniref:LOW QUALITY PROTEIN: latent-transforming growth factor beta-binding protein 4-like n=1 Tax=Ammospiza caudacuta TaxID=2857398 RepID=UPI00273916FC|nr:LOW QUALITY PROTEIN: latent-transforming growth factor beta-binding protein 4-like [Ammospiza caudacuta]